MSVYIGVDLGGTNMRAGRVENDCLVAQASEKTPKSPKDTAETIDLLERDPIGLDAGGVRDWYWCAWFGGSPEWGCL